MIFSGLPIRTWQPNTLDAQSFKSSICAPPPVITTPAINSNLICLVSKSALSLSNSSLTTPNSSIYLAEVIKDKSLFVKARGARPPILATSIFLSPCKRAGYNALA